MKNKLYDQEFLESTLMELEYALKDLSMWSVYNLDKGLEDIVELKVLAKKLKKALI